MIRASPAKSVNFYIILKMNSDFYLYLPTFSNTLSNKLSISFKYYSSFIIYSFFNNYTSSNIFFIQHLIIIVGKKKEFEE